MLGANCLLNNGDDDDHGEDDDDGVPDLYDLYDLAHDAGVEPVQSARPRTCFPWLDLPYKADPARALTTVGEELDDLQTICG